MLRDDPQNVLMLRDIFSGCVYFSSFRVGHVSTRYHSLSLYLSTSLCHTLYSFAHVPQDSLLARGHFLLTLWPDVSTQRRRRTAARGR